MSYDKWIEYKLSDVCDIKYGKDHKKLSDGIIPTYGSGGIMRYVDSYLYDKPSVLIPRKGTLSNLFYVEKKFWTVDTLFWTKINDSIVYPKFLYYLLLTYKFEDMNVGSAVPSLTTALLNEVKVTLPPQQEQEEIANILSSLDDKIETNNKINQQLETLAQLLYKQWFVDFEFPNEEGLPYKSSGGEMVESELGLIPKGWEVKEQDEFFPVVTGKKNANVASDNGKYKFFTCSQQVFTTDDYSFEGEAILVAGNGDFNVKYYNGKFEAYQRTYVLIPNNPKIAGLLYFAIKNNLDDITKGHRGSVINFITKGHLANYKITVPNIEKLEIFSKIFNTIISSIEIYKLENENLTRTRDLLLPKLMSGELRVPIEE